MFETIATIDGMMCGMCESHVNDAIRKAFSVKKVTSSHKKGTTVLLSDHPIEASALQNALAETGYRVTAVDCHPLKKKGLFGFRRT